jgi:hypothetical protein
MYFYSLLSRPFNPKREIDKDGEARYGTGDIHYLELNLIFTEAAKL